MIEVLKLEEKSTMTVDVIYSVSVTRSQLLEQFMDDYNLDLSHLDNNALIEEWKKILKSEGVTIRDLDPDIKVLYP